MKAGELDSLKEAIRCETGNAARVIRYHVELVVEDSA